MSHILDLLEKNKLFTQTFHNKSKLEYHSLRKEKKEIDWSKQAKSFRTYSDTPLKLINPSPQNFPKSSCKESLERQGFHQDLNLSGDLFLEQISTLIKYSLSISAWKKIQNRKYPLRVNPSTGNLHPLEFYFFLNQNTGHPGLFHYNILENTLEQRHTEDLLPILAKATGYLELKDCPSVIVGTGISYRQTWKYGLRGYRYQLLDMGHAAASIMYSASAINLPCQLIGAFPDQSLRELCGLQHLPEEPLCLIPIGKNLTHWNYPPLKPEELPHDHEFQGIPNRLFEEDETYPELEELRHLSLLDVADLWPPQENSLAALPIEAINGKNFTEVSFGRRSALRFDDESIMPLEHLHYFCSSLFNHFNCDFLGSIFGKCRSTLLKFKVLCLHVEGVEDGLYRIHEDNLELEFIQKGSLNKEVQYLFLEQSHIHGANLIFFIQGDFNQKTEIFRERLYRYLHLEAGFLGQTLYLNAENLSYKGLCLASFYDNELNHFLDPHNQETCLLGFAIGKGLKDPYCIPCP